MSPTQRTIAALKKAGYITAITEHWNMYARIRQDMFGFCDILALAPHSALPPHIFAVQCTSGSNHSARVNKIIAEPRALAWIIAGGRIQVWSWKKMGLRGKAKHWTPRIEEIGHERFTKAGALAADQTGGDYSTGLHRNSECHSADRDMDGTQGK